MTRAAFALFAAVAALSGMSEPAQAHAFGERYELPVPVWLFVVGGALTVTVTFVVVAVFARGGAERYAEARLDLTRRALGRVLCHPLTRTAAQAIGVFILALILMVGFFGADDPIRNPAPTLVWVVWWVGFSYVVMLIGNPWPVVNPWRTLFDWVARANPRAHTKTRSGQKESGRYRPYPAGLGAWPAVGCLLFFNWFELIFPFSATPVVLALLVVLYSAATWAGMATYGPEAWVVNVDPFHRVFDVFSRFAPLAPAQARGPNPALVLRPYAAALLQRGQGHVSIAAACFVIAMLASVLFDGLLGSGHWIAVENAVHALDPNLGDVGWILVHTAALLIFWLAVLGLFFLTCALMAATAGASLGTLDYARAFAITLVPIAVGYHFAHTFSYLLIQGQSVVPLISDPFGLGWDVFGPRDYKVNIMVMSTKTAWYLAVGAIVTGHSVSVYLAHVAADRLLANRARAFRCLVPMTVLMIVYTVVSLQILAEPLVRYSGPQETII
ncbi:MAG: hypothetical protein IT564_10840 [Rhodospirillales bacterium]|nr:hypothetical protein [Rhodospirillales bacterium]